MIKVSMGATGSRAAANECETKQTRTATITAHGAGCRLCSERKWRFGRGEEPRAWPAGIGAAAEVIVSRLQGRGMEVGATSLCATAFQRYKHEWLRLRLPGSDRQIGIGLRPRAELQTLVRVEESLTGVATDALPNSHTGDPIILFRLDARSRAARRGSPSTSNWRRSVSKVQ
jgi:hypothetical protein